MLRAACAKNGQEWPPGKHAHVLAELHVQLASGLDVVSIGSPTVKNCGRVI